MIGWWKEWGGIGVEKSRFLALVPEMETSMIRLLTAGIVGNTRENDTRRA